MTQSQKQFTPQVWEIREYIKDLLEYLDGRGIIFEDEELVEEALDSLGSFSRLREIFEIYQNDISEPNTKSCDNCHGFIPEHEYTGNCGLCDDCCKAGFQ